MPTVILVEGLISAGKSTLIHSCLAPLLREQGFDVRIIAEPVDKWVKSGILEKFYTDPKRWAYTFQAKAFHDRIEEARRVYLPGVTEAVTNQVAYELGLDESNPPPPRKQIYLMERSPYSDHIFMTTAFDNGQVTEMEYTFYQEWWKMWHQLLPFTPDLVLYLRTDLDQCMKRLIQRSRPGEIPSSREEGKEDEGSEEKEEGVSVKYQTQLLRAHDEVFRSGPEIAPNIHQVSLGPYQVPSLVVDGNGSFDRNSEVIQMVLKEIQARTAQKQFLGP